MTNGGGVSTILALTDAWLTRIATPRPPRLSARPPRSMCIPKPQPQALLLRLLLLGCFCGGVASASNDSAAACLSQTPSCESTAAIAANYRCECDSSCRYFGSCCSNAEQWPTGSQSGGRADEGGVGPDGRLHSDLYECVPRTYGVMPTYVVRKCPPTVSRTHHVLAAQCNNSDDASLALDARFWPVSSTTTHLVYRSMYCALCYGETDATVVRWSANLNCTLGTNTSNAEELLTRCWVSSYKPPGGIPLPPRCLKDLVDRCELDDTATASHSSDTATSSTSVVQVQLAPAKDNWTNSAISTLTNQESTPVLHQPKRSAIEDGAEFCFGGVQSVVWFEKVPYRNYYCAQCSGIPLAELACTRRPDISPQAPSISMQVLLDPAGPLCRGCALYSSSTGQSKQQQQQVRACRGGEFYDWLMQSCRPFCPPGIEPGRDGICASGSTLNTDVTTELASQLRSETVLQFFNGTTSSLSPFKVAIISVFTEEIFNPNLCNWKGYDEVVSMLRGKNVSQSGVAIGNESLEGELGVATSGEVLYAEVDFNQSNSSVQPTRTNESVSKGKVTFCAYCRWQTLDDPNITIENDTAGIYWQCHWYGRPLLRRAGQTVVVCVDASSAANAVMDRDDNGLSRCNAALDTVAIILLSISIVCLTLHAIAFIFISSLRNMPGRVVFSQVLALLFAYVFYLSRVAVDESSAVACYALSITVHYFLLSYFAWTLVLAVEIHSAVRALRRVYSGARRFMVYSLLGWLLPFVFVIGAFLTDLFGPELLRPGYGLPQCWMSGSYGHLIFFTAPVCTAVLVDLVLYVIVITRVATIARQTARARSSHKEKVILCAKLLLALGVLWTFAVAGALSGNDVILCVFSNVLNTSQGVFIFLIFFCADKGVQAVVRQCLRPGSHGSTLASTISRISTGHDDRSTPSIKAVMFRSKREGN